MPPRWSSFLAVLAAAVLMSSCGKAPEPPARGPAVKRNVAALAAAPMPAGASIRPRSTSTTADHSGDGYDGPIDGYSTSREYAVPRGMTLGGFTTFYVHALREQPPWKLDYVYQTAINAHYSRSCVSFIADVPSPVQSTDNPTTRPDPPITPRSRIAGYAAVVSDCAAPRRR